MTRAYDKLNSLLKELFQFDRKDLDFGIYRIMNHRRKEILRFLDEDLLPQVQQDFSKYRGGDEAQKRDKMAEIERNAARSTPTRSRTRSTDSSRRSLRSQKTSSH